LIRRDRVGDYRPIYIIPFEVENVVPNEIVGTHHLNHDFVHKYWEDQSG
jgi:hypothetical protein